MPLCSKAWCIPGNGSLDFQDILRCLHQEQVDAALDQTDSLLAKNDQPAHQK